MVKPAHSSADSGFAPFLAITASLDVDLNQVGVLTGALQHFQARGLPTPAAWVLPLDALSEIAAANHFFQVLELELSALHLDDIQQRQHISQDLTQHIRRAVIPASVEKAFQRLYDHHLEHHFIAIRPSFISPEIDSSQFSALHLQGEANIMESLLEVWGRLYLPEHLPERVAEWRRGIKLPAALVLQVMVNAESSGVGIFTPASKQRPATVTIFAQWGATPAISELYDQGDWFEIDPKTWQLRQRHVGIKRREWVRRLDHLHSQAVPKHLQAHPALTTQGALALAKMVTAAHKGQFGAYAVDWAAGRQAAYILDSRPFTFHSQTPPSVYFLPLAEQLKQRATTTVATPGNQTTTTKVLVAVGKVAPNPVQTSGADGIGLLRAEWAYLQLPAHPLHLLKIGKADLIRKILTETILQAAATHPADFPVLFRGQNFTTAELRSFEHGQQYEPEEPNPYLGYRGAVRMIHDYTLFDVELDALQDAYFAGVKQLGILLPFVRSQSELAILLHHFRKPTYQTERYAQFWLQLNTPENLLNIAAYCQPGLQGLSLNVQSIQALYQGIDPDNLEVFQLYSVDHQHFYRWLKAARTITQQQQLQLILQLEQYDQKLVEFASELGYDGVTVRAQELHRTRQTVLETERRRVVMK